MVTVADWPGHFAYHSSTSIAPSYTTVLEDTQNELKRR